MDVLEHASGVVFDVVIFVVSKITIFFWNIFRLIGRVFGYPQVQRRQPRQPRNINLARYEDNSVFLGSVSLYRYETSEEIFVYGHCNNVEWDVVLKTVLREKKVDGKNDFYVYTDNPENEMIEAMRMPAPVSVSFLNNAFHSGAE